MLPPSLATLPLLYSFRRCPYAIRARMALHASGVEIQTYEVSLRDKPPAMLQASPKGTVPVLVLPSGQVIDQSLDIMLWALKQNDPLGWLEHDPGDWIARNDTVFKPLLDAYKYPKPDGRSARDQATALILQPMEQVLEGFLCGPQASFADIAVFPFVRQFAAVDTAWWVTQSLPRLQAWLRYWQNNALFELCIRKIA